MDQKQVDEKYPLWKCEERPSHVWKEEEKYGMSAHIYASFPGYRGVECQEYLFSVDIDKAAGVCQRLNENSRQWQPKFNTIGALIN